VPSPARLGGLSSRYTSDSYDKQRKCTAQRGGRLITMAPLDSPKRVECNNSHISRPTESGKQGRERETGRGGERTRKTASLLFRDLFNLIKISFRLFIIFEWGESWSAWKYFTFLSLLLAWSRVDSLSLGAFHEKYLFVTFLWVPRFAGR
jgi:hypothetical protein